ncbi:MAG: cytochrome c biogenesis protein CcdA [Phycisphaerales bacterium]
MSRLGIVAMVVVVMAAMLGLVGPAQSVVIQPADGKMTLTATVQRPKAAPGDQFAIALTMQFEDGWHAWPNQPIVPKGIDVTPTPTVLKIDETKLPKGVNVYAPWAQWPAPHDVTSGAFTGTPLTIKSFSGAQVLFVPVVVGPDAAPGKVKFEVAVNYQACDENVCMPSVDAAATVEFEIVAPGQAGTIAGGDEWAKFDASMFAKILGGATAPAAGGKAKFDFLGYTFYLDSSAYLLILCIAFIAGLLMNFTPCVIPVIPIKILSLQAHAKTPGKLAYFGIVYCLGIVALYAVIGLMAFGLVTGGRKFDWGQIFSLPWFSALMAILIAIMAIGMMGVFTFKLPNFVYAVNPTGDTATGNFVGGLLTGVLAVPCTGPLLGATVAWIATQPPALGLSTFLVMGLGMAAPYALLIAFPKLLSRMPRGGPGGELLKQVLGVFMLAVAAYLASNLVRDKWPWWIVAVLGMGGCVWLLVGAWRMLRSQMAKVVCTVLALIGLPAFFLMGRSLADEGPLAWKKFYDRPDAEIASTLEAAIKQGKVVVIDFTAKWCINCQYIEKNTLASVEGVKLLTAPDVQILKVDLTSSEPDQGWGTVKQISGGGGIPLIAVYGPGIEKPIYFQSFFKASDLEAAMLKARAKASASGGETPSGS